MNETMPMTTTTFNETTTFDDATSRAHIWSATHFQASASRSSKEKLTKEKLTKFTQSIKINLLITTYFPIKTN